MITWRESALGLLVGSLLVFGCAPGSDTAAQDQAHQGAWPGDEWPQSTLVAEGIGPGAIDSLITDIDAGRYGLIDDFLLIRHGRVVADYHWDHSEAYRTIAASQQDTVNHQFNYDHPDWHPFYRGTNLHTLQSVTKSVASVALGIAIDQGRIRDVEVSPWSYLGAYEPDTTDPRRAATTLEDFLTMRSGIAWANAGETYNDAVHPTVVLEGSDQWIQYVVDRPMATEPGTRFDYNDGVSVLLGKIVREATGIRIDEWAEENLFGPIGIDEYYWKITPDGEADSEGGLYLSKYDLARIGYLMLRNGVWNGKQVVSQEWVHSSVSPVVSDVNPANNRADAGYGYQWWVPSHEDGEASIFAGNGYGGQFMHVSPEFDLIAVFNGWNIHAAPELSSWMAMQDRILPAVRPIDPQ